MKFLTDLENFLRSKFAAYPATPTLALEPCPAGQEGDFTLNCFKIARFCGNPAAAAQTFQMRRAYQRTVGIRF